MLALVLRILQALKNELLNSRKNSSLLTLLQEGSSILKGFLGLAGKPSSEFSNFACVETAAPHPGQSSRKLPCRSQPSHSPTASGTR